MALRSSGRAVRWRLSSAFSCSWAAATYHQVYRVRDVGRRASIKIDLDRIEDVQSSAKSKRISSLTLRKLDRWRRA
jgi:hypothetical protein